MRKRKNEEEEKWGRVKRRKSSKIEWENGKEREIVIQQSLVPSHNQCGFSEYKFLGYVYPLPEFSTNRSGLDFPLSPFVFPADTPYTACQFMCQNDPKCAAWSYQVASFCLILLFMQLTCRISHAVSSSNTFCLIWIVLPDFKSTKTIVQCPKSIRRLGVSFYQLGIAFSLSKSMFRFYIVFISPNYTVSNASVVNILKTAKSFVFGDLFVVLPSHILMAWSH